MAAAAAGKTSSVVWKIFLSLYMSKSLIAASLCMSITAASHRDPSQRLLEKRNLFFFSSSSFYHSCRFILIRWETTSLQHYIAVVSVNLFRFLPHHFLLLLLLLFPFDQKTKKKRRTAGRKAGLRLSRLLIFAPCWGPAFAGGGGHGAGQERALLSRSRERERG